ncbi:hypothetical protein Cni_G17287 [Canna indica]|uniref:Uncharacterized protein n=1 Tax=Canna indica TaxID=4628 RepID=A0AAQ3QEY5_9LILI|nr:hypothetical protein Cni_G17287 [Canna indica]
MASGTLSAPIGGDGERVEAKCVSRGVRSQMHCPWGIYRNWKSGETTFLIKSYVKEHKCSRCMKNRQATVEWLANYYMEQFRQNPSCDVKLMAMDFQSKFYISIARAKWYRVRSYTLEKLRGSVEDHYALLGSYLAELRKKNPASLFNIGQTSQPSRGRGRRGVGRGGRGRGRDEKTQSSTIHVEADVPSTSSGKDRGRVSPSGGKGRGRASTSSGRGRGNA